MRRILAARYDAKIKQASSASSRNRRLGCYTSSLSTPPLYTSAYSFAAVFRHVISVTDDCATQVSPSCRCVIRTTPPPQHPPEESLYVLEWINVRVSEWIDCRRRVTCQRAISQWRQWYLSLSYSRKGHCIVIAFVLKRTLLSSYAGCWCFRTFSGSGWLVRSKRIKRIYAKRQPIRITGERKQFLLFTFMCTYTSGVF